MDSQLPRFYAFDPFLFDTSKLRLTRDGQAVPIQPKVAELLVLLLRNRGQVVAKETLIESLWPSSYVAEASLNQTVYLLRKALGGERGGDAYVKTIKKRGFCFVAEVSERDGDEGPERPASGQSEPAPRGSLAVSAESAPQGVDGAPPAGGAKKASRGLSRGGIFLWVVAACVPAAILVYWLSAGATRAPDGDDIKTIAVLPFRTIGAGDEGELIGLGMADALITKLGYVKRFVVRQPSSVFKYVDQQYDPVAVGRDLGVDAVFVGTVQKDGGRVRVSLRLIGVSDGSTRWATTYDEPFTNSFILQDTVTRRVARAWGLEEAGAGGVRLAPQFTNSVEAYEAYLRGFFFWNKSTTDSFSKSIECLNEAVAKDPDYALAYGLLADAYACRGMDQLSERQRNEDFARAGEAARRALELDEKLPEAHDALFLVKLYDEGDKDGAEREIKRSLELNPASGTAHSRYAEYYINFAMLSQAETEQRLALEFDPLSVVGNSGLCELLYLKGDYDQALQYCRRAAAIEPDFPRALYQIALIDIEKGLYEEATGLLDEVKARSKAACHSTRGYIYARTGHLDKTREELRLKLREGQQADQDYHLAMLYSALGDEDRAFEHIEALRGRILPYLAALKFDPRFAALRANPRFEPFIKALTEYS